MVRVSRGAIFVAAAISASTWASSAVAGSNFASRDVRVGPELLRGNVVWGERTAGGQLAVAWRSHRRLKRERLPAPDRERGVAHEFRDMAGDSHQVAFIRQTRTRLDHRADVVAAPPRPPARYADALLVGRVSGQYSVVARAKRSDEDEGERCTEGPVELQETEMASRAVAFLETVRVCSGRRPLLRDRVVLLRPHGDRMTREVIARTPPRRTYAENATIFDLRMAGPYIAWVRDRRAPGDPQAACVYDREAKSITYCLRAPSPQLEDILEWVALQEDGKLALGTGADHELIWSSVSEPWPHRAGPTFVNEFGPSTADTAFARNLIAFNRQRETGPNDLALTDLHGNATSIFAPKKGQALGGVDFDGRRIAWTVFERDESRATLNLSGIDMRLPGP